MGINTADYLQQDPEKVMQTHGKSFFWASQLFSKVTMPKVSLLYAFCRYVDDTADENAPEIAAVELTKLEESLRNGSTPLMARTRTLFQAESIAMGLADQLIAGARFDVNAGVIASRTDLLRYCYRVAGVVGLMMCPIIGVRQRSAHAFALDLGLGMQLTNICRDVLEDAQNNRRYLPLDELAAAGCSDIAVLQSQNTTPAALRQLTAQYLELADDYYQSAAHGFAYIPLRPRLAILVASRLYQAIGHKIRRQGCNVLAGRVYLGTVEKIFVTLRCTTMLFRPSFWVPQKAHAQVLHRELSGLPGVAQ